jgi:hypothetical protein
MLPIAPEVFGATATAVVAGTLIGSEVASVVGGIAVLTGVTTGVNNKPISIFFTDLEAPLPHLLLTQW